MNANIPHYKRNRSSPSSGDKSDKSIAALIKKEMAKIPMSYNTKKSIDEYYKNAMNTINKKIKEELKAKKAVIVKKSKKRGGNSKMSKEEELSIIDNVIRSFIRYNNRLIREGVKYINRDSGSYRDDINAICQELKKLDYNVSSITDEKITLSLGSSTNQKNIYDTIDAAVSDIIQNIIYENHQSVYKKYATLYNAKDSM